MIRIPVRELENLESREMPCGFQSSDGESGDPGPAMVSVLSPRRAVSAVGSRPSAGNSRSVRGQLSSLQHLKGGFSGPVQH